VPAQFDDVGDDPSLCLYLHLGILHDRIPSRVIGQHLKLVDRSAVIVEDLRLGKKTPREDQQGRCRTWSRGMPWRDACLPPDGVAGGKSPNG